MIVPSLPIASEYKVTSVDALEALYGPPVDIALTKEIDHISDHYRAFVEASPFVALATVGPEGLDCSPRGDPRGFVRIHDDKTVLMPDRRGNNRTDTLHNIVCDSRVALLFLIPGVNETLRINGRADIVADPDLCASFDMNGKTPTSVLVVHVDSVYYQCPKALVRSRLWDAEAQISRKELPSNGEMLAALAPGEIDAEAYEAAYPVKLKETIY
jgi:PPOX class probable FMN-dependent enzyme